MIEYQNASPFLHNGYNILKQYTKTSIFRLTLYLQTSANIRDPSVVVTGCGTGQEVMADMTSDSMVDKLAYEDAKK